MNQREFQGGALLADSAGSLKRPDGTLRNDPTKYRDTLAALRGPDETPDGDAMAGITAANHDMAAWAKELVAEGS